MYNVLTLIIVLSRLTRDVRTSHTCTPNTQFLYNGRLCYCDKLGRWNESNCKIIRRQSCRPGQIIWQGCNQCICQENGYILCSNSRCFNNSYKNPPFRQDLTAFGHRCTPFRSYYINCSICTCPASGIAKEAQCLADVSCDSQPYWNDIASIEKILCIPNVMYISPCMHCLCSDLGYFRLENCVNMCEHSPSIPSTKRCNPGKMFRMGCSICRCLDNGMQDERLCIKTTCSRNTQPAHVLRTNTKICIPHSFTVPRCMFCSCNSDGSVNENACLEIDCAKASELNKFHVAKDMCNPGEMVPICIECFCSRNGQTTAKYCSRYCNHRSKLSILEMILKDIDITHYIERSQIKSIRSNENCIPNMLYLVNGQYCLCPRNGDPDFKLCTSVTEDTKGEDQRNQIPKNKIEIDYSSPCEPNSFVEFDCNTCYCAGNGKIDPKWCTYDDCEAKRLILESHKIHNPAIVDVLDSGNCRPGSISKFKCNFCICPQSGILKEQACTQNECTEIDYSLLDDKLTCEPLAYYEIDCNICYCPRDGIKNLAKCTTNKCEKRTLRSDSCIPGQLFSDDCNLCVCPPDGNRMGKACTDHTCPQIPSWTHLTLSDDLSDVVKIKTRSLDQCFPGEEFEEDCNLCMCPELGLKMYAACDFVLCENNTSTKAPNLSPDNLDNGKLQTQNSSNNTHLTRSRRSQDTCFTYNISHSAERKECTPGTMYIIRCKQCICPYFGNINNFCRPLPKNMFCEQAFPNYNYIPMGRRGLTANISSTNQTDTTRHVNNTSVNFKKEIQVKVVHNHTQHSCEKPGTITDGCFICDCEDNVVIEEHCFKSDAQNCTDEKPTFLSKYKLDI